VTLNNLRTVEELITEALSLPRVSRVLLVEKLIESLEFDVDETIIHNNREKSPTLH
jgi:hypothetical protein